MVLTRSQDTQNTRVTRSSARQGAQKPVEKLPVRRRAARKGREGTLERTKNYYLLCTDADGTKVKVSYSADGEGTHAKWQYPEAPPNNESANEDEGIPSHPNSIESRRSGPLSKIPNPIERFHTPVPEAVPASHSLRTPAALRSFDAGSVLRTPVKKLQRSPDRIGYNGVNFWKDDESGVLTGRMFVDEKTGFIRYIPNNAAGNNIDMTKAEVFERQLKDDERIFLDQIEKLFDRNYREGVERRMMQREGSDSGFEDMDENMEAKISTSAQPQTTSGKFGPHGTVIIEESDEEEGDDDDFHADDDEGHPPTPRFVSSSPASSTFRFPSVAPTELHEMETDDHPRLPSVAPSEPDVDADKENHPNGTVRLGSIISNGGTIYEVFVRPKRARQGSVTAAPLQAPKPARRTLGPHGTQLIDPITYRAYSP